MTTTQLAQPEKVERLILDAIYHFGTATQLLSDVFMETTRLQPNGSTTFKEKSAERCRGLAIQEAALAMRSLQDENVYERLNVILENIRHVIDLSYPQQETNVE